MMETDIEHLLTLAEKYLLHVPENSAKAIPSSTITKFHATSHELWGC
jgi:hypothetical protein